MVLWAFARRAHFEQLALTLLLVYVVSDVVYLFFQTYVPRPAVTGHGVFSHLARFIYSNDQPYCGLPSEHSSQATVFAFYLMAIGNRWRYVGTAFALLVIASTLLVKQHFILDAVSGIGLGAAAFGLLFLAVPRFTHRWPTSLGERE